MVCPLQQAAATPELASANLTSAKKAIIITLVAFTTDLPTMSPDLPGVERMVPQLATATELQWSQYLRRSSFLLQC